MSQSTLNNVIRTLSRDYRIDLILGALVKIYEREIERIKYVTHQDISQIKRYLSEALHNREKLSEIERIVADFLGSKLNELPAIFHDDLTIYLLLRQTSLANKAVKTLKREIEKVEAKLIKIRELISYYYIPRSFEEITELWRIPKEWSDEALFNKLFVEDERITNIIDKATRLILGGSNVIIIGEPGVGKTSLLYRLVMELSRIRNIGLVIPGTKIGSIHEELGIVLFIDDLPQQLLDYQRLSTIKNLIATARIHEWLDLTRDYPEIKQNFVELKLERAPDEFLKDVLLRLLSQYKIDYDENALQIVVKKALGTPMYLYQLIKDLIVIKRQKDYVKLDIAIAETIPAGMYEYIGELLSNTIANKNGGKSMLAALKCIALSKTKTIHSLHLATLYENLCRELGERPNWDLYSDVHQLMVYDTIKMMLKIPHDTWIDVMQGASRILNPMIHLIDTKVPDRVKMEMLRKSGEESWRKVYEDLVYLINRELAKENDINRALILAEALKAEFPDIDLVGLDEVKEYAKNIVSNQRLL